MKDELKYRELPRDLAAEIKADMDSGWMNPGAFKEEDFVRRNPDRDRNTLLRPSSIRDIEKILHLPLYNRYADKTQVFSFYNNDDITRRALHVQLVSRIARNIGRLLGLNLDLIEAIALGHDLGHTPFGHGGEAYLNELLHGRTGLYFNHNVQSVRVLDTICCRNMMLQTLDGILCHNGELEQQEYRPMTGKTFDDLDREVKASYEEGAAAIRKLVPMTLEGCVVRVSDMIAYLGKDRQDAITAHIIDDYDIFDGDQIGSKNAEIINNLVVDIVENSYRRDYISMSEVAFADLVKAKEENYRYIYKTEGTNPEYGDVKPMFARVYEHLLDDLLRRDADSVIYRHHLDFVRKQQQYYTPLSDYSQEPPDLIVCDFMASMTDDYFLDLYEYLFPGEDTGIRYHSYFGDHRK
ncbi:MAG: deoxyguanosinetriphosphate triphosphohydrolase family protein [Anaerovoracaceae bacterium]|jgi:dGTPase